MRESTLLKPNNQGIDSNHKLNEIIIGKAKSAKPDLDYLGKEFVYDDYNQDPDLVQENKFGLKTFFTRDKKFINQYYALRDEIYKFENGWAEYDGSEKEFDRVGRLMVVVKDDHVVGGSRLMFSDECPYLSNEHPGTVFQYKKVLERYENRCEEVANNLSNMVISEISAVASNKEGRNSEIVESIFMLSAQASKERSCYCVCGVAQVALCRFYRMVWHKLKYELEIVMTNPWDKKKTYNYSQMFPIYVKV